MDEGTEVTDDLPAQTQSGQWSFVMNKIDVKTSLPFDIAPGVRLIKADDVLVERIKKTLGNLLGKYESHWASEYECSILKETSDSGGHSFSYHPLPKEDWRYFVVETDDNGQKAIDLQFSSSVSMAPLDVLTMQIKRNNGVSWRMGSIQNRTSFSIDNKISILRDFELLDARESYDEYLKLKGDPAAAERYPEIIRALRLFDSLDVLPRWSDFHILGLFSIIEMLITHNPHLEDRGDSITHQMQSKIPLLAKRFPHKISYDAFSPSVNEKRIWTALYGYRSTIAHGGVAKFSDNSLRILRSSDVAREFLEDVTRKMIRHAFREPELYRDIKNC